MTSRLAALAASSWVRGRPAGLLARVLLWPTLVLLASYGAAGTQDDGLAAGLLGFLVLAGTCGLLALVDGLVLRRRPLVLVWSVTTLVLVVAITFSGVVDALGGTPTTTGGEAVRAALDDLPAVLPVLLVVVAGPALLGGVVGRLVRRPAPPRPVAP